jgi:iron complex transport system substrate-binding protein
MLRRLLLSLALAAPLATLAAPAAAWAADPPPRIADLWYAHNAVLVMLGAADEVAVTVARPASFPWMYRIAPALHHATVVNAGAPNAETLLAAHVNLAFVAQDREADRLNALGVHTMQVGFSDLPSLRESLRRTADAIGTPIAHRRAQDYDSYLDTVIARLDARLNGVPDAKRPRVLHIVSFAPLRVDGSDTIIDQWIRLAGGRNAATGLSGNMQPVSLEQVASWQPDLIIVGGNAGDPPKGDLWADLAAVRDGHVVRNPQGVFPWDRYGTEFALQLQWAAKLLHPDLFAATDMTAETSAFYRRFFGYDMPAAEAALVLAAQPPPLQVSPLQPQSK